MPEAIVTRYACYILKTQLTETELEMLHKTLTFEKQNQYNEIPENVIRAYRETCDKIYLPFRFVERTMTLDITNFESRDPVTCLSSAVPPLRPQQIPVVTAVLNRFTGAFGNAFIVAPTGSGKTVMTLTVVAAKRVKTLIVVPRQALADQWETQIKLWLPGWTRGTLKGATVQIPGDITVVVLRTMGMSEIPKSFFTEIALLVFDEIHNIAADTMSTALFRFQPHFLLGLSATPDRIDGMEVLFKYFFGKRIEMGGSLEKQQSVVRVHKYRCETIPIKIGKDKLNLSRMLTSLALEPPRITLIVEIIRRAIERPHVVLLVMSDRRALLETLAKTFEAVAGLLVGGTSAADFTLTATTKRVLLGTYAVVSEGFDCKRVNELLLATPRSNVKQAIGRIFRQTHVEAPVIYDIEDSLQVYKAQQRKRLVIYKAEIKDVVIHYT